MTETQSSRFKDAPWFPKEETHVVIGGAGGIGSWLALMLTRAGFNPIVYDFDVLEEHNMGGQLYPKCEIGSPKVTALQSILIEFADTRGTMLTERFTKDSMQSHYMFSAFDNMQARKDMFEAWCKFVEEWKDYNDAINCGEAEAIGNEYKQVPVFIDGRLTAEQMQIFCVTPDRIEDYKRHLFDDSEVPDAPCTMKQTSHSAAMIASHMTGFFTNHFTNNQVGEKDRIVPFYWEYFIPINYINTID